MEREKTLLLGALRYVQSVAGAHSPSARDVAAELVKRELGEMVLSTGELFELLMLWSQQWWTADSADRIGLLLRTEIRQVMEAPPAEPVAHPPTRHDNFPNGATLEPLKKLDSIYGTRLRQEREARQAKQRQTRIIDVDPIEAQIDAPAMDDDEIADASDAHLHRLIVARLPQMGQVLPRMSREELERIARSAIRSETRSTGGSSSRDRR